MPTIKFTSKKTGQSFYMSPKKTGPNPGNQRKLAGGVLTHFSKPTIV